MTDKPRDGHDDALPGDVVDRNDTSFEVELDEPPEPGQHAPVYVDVVAHEHELRPIIPASLRGWSNIKASIRYHSRRTGAIGGYHALRAPLLYLPLTAFWAVVGVFRLAGRQLRWWWVHEQHLLRQEAANNNDADTWMKLHREAKISRLWRGWVLVAELVALVVAIALLVTVAPWWVRVLALVAAVPFLQRVGRPPDRPIVRSAVVTPRFRKLNSDIVLRAYYSAKLGDPDKRPISFASTMSRDVQQKGSQVVVDLDYGYTFDDAVKAKAAIASGLDVTEQQVFLTRDKTSTRRHALYVADRDPLAIPAGRTPLLDCRPRDIWQACPFGLDERDRKVAIEMMWRSFLIGAQPRKGKTFSARLLALFAALDPYVKITLADGKDSPDWVKFALVADRYIHGVAPNRFGDPIEQLIEALEDIKTDIMSRNDKLSQLPMSVCPEGKLTREIARDPRYGMPVRVLVMEEFQNYFETPDQKANAAIAQLLSYVLAVGPSSGVIPISSSQKPSGVGAGDVQRLFNRYRDNHDVRFALRCGNRNVSDAILGGEAYSEGYDASALPLGKEYRGVGILYAYNDDTPIVRTYLADGEDAEKILLAARRHREAASTLTGEAAGEDVSRQARDVLADVRGVYYAGEAWISWPQIAQRLREQLPEHYADITPGAISELCRALHVESKDGRDKFDGNRVVKGAKVASVEASIKRRELESGR